MNSSTWAWAFAWIKKVVFINLSLLKADFTRIFMLRRLTRIELHNFSISINFLFIFCWANIKWAINKNLTDIELNSSNFHSLSRLQFISFWLSINVFNFTNNYVCFLFTSRITFDRLIGFDSIRLNLFFWRFFFTNKM